MMAAGVSGGAHHGDGAAAQAEGQLSRAQHQQGVHLG